MEKENGYSFRSFEIKFPEKPFSMNDLQNTWFLSVPDGKGNVTNSWGKWVDGKMAEEGRETIPDPLEKLFNKNNDHGK